jgi:hypothetical protein
MKNLLILLVLLIVSTINVIPQKMGDAYRFNINNLNIPINRVGTIATVNIPPEGPGGRFGNGTFLFSSGFFMSGLTNGNLWAFAQASASLIENMIPGTVESGPNDPDAVIYVVNKEDEPFGDSWQDWADAVALGADFYDGNGDEFYNPVDLNGNNQWDPDEDMPDLLGDETAWCVYWDGQPGAQRIRFQGVQPQGIEIRQTMFAIDTTGEEGNIIFLRYRISNSGLVSERLDSVIFSVWADPDLGEEFDDDLVGVDVSRNAGFTYNGDDSDPQYGSQIPSFFMDFLSGPAAYIPSETFIDNNGDGIYTEGIDTPLDTAYTFRGQLLGIKELPGAKNLDISSFVHYIQSDPLRGDPNNEFEARNYGLGRLKLGEFIDPCNDTWGQVFGIPCDDPSIDTRFWYSGDPVTNVGWINTGPTDQRQMTNVGPFTLRQDEEIEVFVAYVVGQGSDRLNSITVARNISDIAQTIYDSNFDFTVSIEDETQNLPTEFLLSQNYPNPFNPSTKIKFSLPSSGYTTLRIYNALGEEVAVLIDKELDTGSYEVGWNAAGLPSGVYFYQLKIYSANGGAEGFLETKKMMLLK